MKNLFFVKMSGAGNDFVVFDKDLNPDLVLDSDKISKICDRHNGVGADGVITIANFNGYDFEMEYFNADGSTGSLCGNGARCGIRYAESTQRIKGKNTRFVSNGREYYGEIINDKLIRFYFDKPTNYKPDFKLNASGQKINAHFIDTGSPHVVVFIDDILKNSEDLNSIYSNINEINVYELGKEIRNLPEFMPGGTNVNFISTSENKIYIRTYERGVENETLACGTGNAAAAIVINKIKGISTPIQLINRSGENLTVEFEKNGGNIRNLTLTGPAKIVFTGELISNNLLN